MNLRTELSRELAAEHYDQTDAGVYFPRQGVLARGEYIDRINGSAWERTKNLIVTEGLVYILNVALGSVAKPTAFYIALFSGSTAPTASWTAAQFPSVAGEIVSLTEGYTNATRPAWKPTDASSTSAIDNTSNVASITMATTGSLTVTGAALLTSSVRGGTTGALISATKYASARTFQDGDTYDIGYRLTLSAS
jgi:hypothetical protein